MTDVFKSYTGLDTRDTTKHAYYSRSVESQLSPNRFIYLEERRGLNENHNGYKLALALVDESLPEELAEREREKISKFFTRALRIKKGYPFIESQIGNPYRREDIDSDKKMELNNRLQAGVRCLWVDIQFFDTDLSKIGPFILPFKQASERFIL